MNSSNLNGANKDASLEQILMGEFHNEEVNIDGMHFEKCKFNKCTIVVSGGRFNLVSNHFQDCRLSLKGEAANVGMLIHLFQKGVGKPGTNRPKE